MTLARRTRSYGAALVLIGLLFGVVRTPLLLRSEQQGSKHRSRSRPERHLLFRLRRSSSQRIGKNVKIAYSFPVWPRDPARRPVMLLTAVQSSGTRYAPYMKRHRISTRAGVVHQPLGLGSAPFKLYAASYSRRGMSSKTVVVPVRDG